jgi:hypothetical protein
MSRLAYSTMSPNLLVIFFGCAVASQAWKNISDVVGFPIGLNYESVSNCCLCNKKFGCLIS